MASDTDARTLPFQYGKPLYTEFVRVFVPAGSIRLSAGDLDESLPSYTVHNEMQGSGYFVLPSHHTRTIVFQYRIPANVDPGSRYTLLVQKQPGTGMVPLRIVVTAVPGVRLRGTTVRLATDLSGEVGVEATLSGGTPRPCTSSRNSATSHRERGPNSG